jgi:ABC-2 type transport system permease protein
MNDQPNDQPNHQPTDPALVRSSITSQRQVVLVARREIIERVRQRSFLISTLVSLAIIIAVAVLPKLLNSPTKWTIGTTDARSQQIAEIVKSIIVRSEPKAKVTIRRMASTAMGTSAVKKGEIGTLITASGESDPKIVVHRRLDDQRRAVLDAAIQRDRVLQRAERLGIAPDKALELAAPGSFVLSVLDPPDAAKEGDVNLARIAMFILFFLILQYGNFIALGVVEEKQSRVLEVLLGRARATTILTGKLLGLAVVGIGQICLFLVVGLTAAQLSGALSLSMKSIGVGVMVLLWFVVGYGFFSALFVVAGSLAGRQEDLQNTSGLPMIVSMGSYIASTIFNQTPESTGALIASFVPSSAPLMVPVRWASGDSPLWQVGLSVLVSVIAIVILLRFAGRLYMRTVLMTTRQTLFSIFRRKNNPARTKSAKSAKAV